VSPVSFNHSSPQPLLNPLFNLLQKLFFTKKQREKENKSTLARRKLGVREMVLTWKKVSSKGKTKSFKKAKKTGEENSFHFPKDLRKEKMKNFNEGTNEILF